MPEWLYEFYPLLVVGAVISLFATAFILAYIFMKDKKEAIGFDRDIKDSEIIKWQATRANSDGLVSAVHNCLNLANVGLPGAVGLTVRVRNILSVHNTLSTDTAFCHT